MSKDKNFTDIPFSDKAGGWVKTMQNLDIQDGKTIEFDIKPDDETMKAVRKELIEPMLVLRKQIEDMLMCDAREQTEKLKFESTQWTDEQIKQFKDLMVRFAYDSMCIGWNRCHEFLNQEKEQHTISKFRKQ